MHQRERDHSNHGGDRHQQGIADFPSEQHRQGHYDDQEGQPIPDRNASEENARAQDGTDRSGVAPLTNPCTFLLPRWRFKMGAQRGFEVARQRFE